MAGIPDYSTTASANTSVGGNSVAEGWAPSAVNNAIRALMADIAKWRARMEGAKTSTGSANAYALSSGESLSAYAEPYMAAFTANFSNTGSATLNIDALGAKTIKRSDGSTLGGGEIVNGGTYFAVYEGAADCFYLVNPSRAIERMRVRAATTANITIASGLNNGSSLDGVTLATGDLVLVKDQSTAADNGIYLVGATPARAAGFVSYNDHPGSIITVQEGTTNADTAWLCTSNVGGTLGSTAIAFTNLVPAVTGVVKTVKSQVFTSSGTYTPSTGMLYCQIMCLGGGGGGGGVTSGADHAGGGGGVGGMSLGIHTAADIGASQTVTIGSAGGGASSGNNSGGSGGDTSVGTLCIGKGASGGGGSASSSGGAGGAGGVAGTGNVIAAVGGNGLTGVGGSAGTGGNGGNSLYGGGGVGQSGNGNGNAASGRGAGGGGSKDAGSSGNKSGGAGTAGLVIITEYCSQ